MSDTEATQEQLEEIFQLFGVAFGLNDVILLGSIGIGIFWYFVLREDKSKTDATFPKHPNTSQPNSSETDPQNDNKMLHKMKASGRNIVVFYGSQTGTAEEFARRLAKEAPKYGMKGMVENPEDCNMEDLTQLKEIKNSLAIFCIATYGEGDPTDNAHDFYNWLQQGGCELFGLNYAVFALGNKTYEHFNAIGKYVDMRLEELGGTRVFEMGSGDDDSNIEEDFIAWKAEFWPAVCEKFGVEPSGEDFLMRQYRLVMHDNLAPERVHTGEIARLHSYKTQRPPFDFKNPFLSQMILKRELHSGGDRSCMHIEMDISNSQLRYDSGDHLAVYPKNDLALVEKLGELLEVDLDTVFSLVDVDEDSSKKHPFPCPCSYRTALSYYVDITSNPRTHVFKELVEYASNESEKHLLKLLGGSTPEGKEKYKRWVLGDCRNIVHVLDDLQSCKPPVDLLCEVLPRLQCRYYSISSSPRIFPNSIHITAALVKYATPTGRVSKGVATNYLDEISPTPLGEGKESDSRVPVFVRKSQFRLPSKSETPVIMIGPGTGIAPFRGFIQERGYLKSEGKPIGKTILYFGCRHKAEDYIYQQELEEYVEDGVLTKIYAAFSRDQEEKIYVQHLLAKQATEVWSLIGQENGHVYVCGDAKNMARDVHDVIKKIVREQGGMTEAEASVYVKRMEAQKRYSTDVWS